MSMIMPPGSMPEWTYWMWGVIGFILLYVSYHNLHLRFLDGHREFDLMALFEGLFGLFLVIYWLDKIHII